MEQRGPLLDFSRPDPPPPGRQAVDFKSWNRQTTVPDEEWRANIELNVKRGLPEFAPAIIRNQSEVHIVGSGPSLGDPEVFDELKKAVLQNRPLIAVKDAHDWLIERGIVPDLAVMMDPQAHRVSCVQKKRPEVGYLIASQCHPDVFDWLADCQVVMWHGASDGSEDKLLGEGRLKVTGGSTTGLRAMTLAYLMGFHKFVLYGFDSCMRDGVKRITGAPAPEHLMPIFAGKNPRKFMCNGAMAAQATEFQLNWQMMPDAQFRVVGDGLIAAIMEERIKDGLGGDLPPPAAVGPTNQPPPGGF